MAMGTLARIAMQAGVRLPIRARMAQMRRTARPEIARSSVRRQGRASLWPRRTASCEKRARACSPRMVITSEAADLFPKPAHSTWQSPLQSEDHGQSSEPDAHAVPVLHKAELSTKGNL